MNWKTAGLALVALVVLAGIVYAATQYSGEQTGTVTTIDLSITFNEVALENGGTMEWGELDFGEPTSYILAVTNEDDIDIEVAFLCPDLPGTWNEEWTPDTTTLGPTEIATGPLTLTAREKGPFTLTWQITATEVEETP